MRGSKADKSSGYEGHEEAKRHHQERGSDHQQPFLYPILGICMKFHYLRTGLSIGLFGYLLSNILMIMSLKSEKRKRNFKNHPCGFVFHSFSHPCDSVTFNMLKYTPLNSNPCNAHIYIYKSSPPAYNPSCFGTHITASQKPLITILAGTKDNT